jgi:hypothetical protein
LKKLGHDDTVKAIETEQQEGNPTSLKNVIAIHSGFANFTE